MTSPEQRIAAISDEWLQVCGGCDAGMGPCTHPEADYRTPMQELAFIASDTLTEAASLRAEVAEARAEIEWQQEKLIAQDQANAELRRERGKAQDDLALLPGISPPPWPRCAVCGHAALYHLGHDCEPGDCECDCGGYRPTPTLPGDTQW